MKDVKVKVSVPVVHITDPDDLVRRFYSLLEENKQLRKRFEEQCQIIESKRGTIQMLRGDVERLTQNLARADLTLNNIMAALPAGTKDPVDAIKCLRQIPPLKFLKLDD